MLQKNDGKSIRVLRSLSHTLALPFNERIKKFVEKDWSLGDEQKDIKFVFKDEAFFR